MENCGGENGGGIDPIAAFFAHLVSFVKLFGATPEQIRAIVLDDWIVRYSPFELRDGTWIEQWKFTSLDGLQEVRIHETMLAVFGHR